MKQFTTLLICLLLTGASLMAQAPSRINYQAVARDAAGKPLANKAIKLRLSVLNGSASGTAVYVETHSVTTNDFGHFAVLIGAGTASTGSMAGVNWETSTKFLKVEFDPNGGTTYTNMGTAQLVSVPYSLLSAKASALATGSTIDPSQISGGGANSGQVLQWNGSSWTPTTPSGGGGGADNWGTQTAAVGTALSGNGTTGNPLNIAQQGATSGQVLRWNGTAWLPGTVTGAADNWGTQTVAANSTLSGAGTSGNQLGIAQQGATNGQVLQWNGTTWIPATITGSDNWGTQTATTSGPITGNGTSGNPITLGQLGATNGQVLSWNGSGWSPANPTGDNWGTQAAVTGAALTGNGTTTSPLNIAQNGATSGQFLQWNGTAWIPVTASVGGDNWGTQTAAVGTTLSGNGTAASPLRIAQQGATSGQIMQWNGTDWAPATGTTVGDNWGTQVTQTNATMSGNGTAANPLRIAQQGATTGQFLQWNGTTWVPITLTGDNWGSQSVVTNTTLAGNGTTTSPLALAPQGATNGQVLKFIGGAWVPRNDSAGGTYTANNGVNIAGSNIALGGALTSPTTIATTGANTLALTGLSSGTTADSVLVTDAASGSIRRISSGRIGATYTSSNGMTLTGTNFILGGALTAPTTITTTGANTLALAGLSSGTNADSILVADAASGSIRRISSSRLGGSGGTYTASNGLTLTGTNFTLGGTLTSPITINTSQTNNIAINGLWSGFDDDSVLTSNAANNIINRQHRDRISLWRRDVNQHISYKNGNVSIGSDTSKARLYVQHTTSTNDTGVYIQTNSSSTLGNVSMVVNNNNSANVLNGVGIRTNAGFTGIQTTAGINGIVAFATSPAPNAGLTQVGVTGVANGNALGATIGVLGDADTSNFSIGVRGLGGAVGVLGNARTNNSKAISLAFGFSTPFKSSVLGYSSGVNLTFGNASLGVLGVADASNTIQNTGVNGVSKSNTTVPYSIGVLGEAMGGANFQVGVWGQLDTPRLTASVKRSGVFIDTLEVVGHLIKSSGTFRIDHPLDPENKFLDHSFVESPDMMNVYNGNITTDAHGYATVQLPTYFMALNKDFRYQLTAIGEFSQVIVKEKIKDNQFVIQSEKANIEVSWQITGIRNDPYAQKHRIVDEVPKGVQEKGKYLRPDLYNQPANKGIYYREKNRSIQQTTELNNSSSKKINTNTK